MADESPGDEPLPLEPPGAARDSGTSEPPGDQGDLGRYQLLFELARGGMGTVHVGRLQGAHGFDRLVAIKRLRTRSGTEEDLAAFLREARLSAKIHHPNVVQTIELGEHQGRPFLVMELIEGVSLADLQRRIADQDEPLEPLLAAWIAAQTATGLHAAHELCGVDGEPYGLVHRDVSPENILLSFDGRVCVADFGVAQFTDVERRTRSGVVKGKFAYMSPEQTEAQPLDRRSDIFSLGIVLHECLTGEPLFEGRNVPDTIRRIWSLEPADPSRARSEVPEALGPIALRCLRHERDDRYDTADELARALRALLSEPGSRVDETALRELLAQHFPERRRELRRRIGDAIRTAERPDSASEVAVEPAPQDPPDGHGSVAASVTAALPLRRQSLAGPLLVVALVALVALLVMWLGPEDDPPVPAADRPSAAPVSSSAVALDLSRSASPAVPDEGSHGIEQPDAAPTTAGATPSPPPGRPPSRPTPAPGTETSSAPTPETAPSATPAPSTSADHKGVPFQSLDP